MSKVNAKYFGNQQQHHNPEHTNYLIHNLTQEICYLKSALQKAEDLINTYQKQNQSLQNEKQQIQIHLQRAQHKINVLEQALKNTHYNDKQLAQLSERITILTELQHRKQYQLEQKEMQIKQLQSLLSDKNDQRISSIEKSMDQFRKDFISKNMNTNQTWYSSKNNITPHVPRNPKLISATQRSSIKFKKLKDGKVISYLQTTMYDTDDENAKLNSTNIKTASSAEFHMLKKKTSRSECAKKMVWK